MNQLQNNTTCFQKKLTLKSQARLQQMTLSSVLVPCDFRYDVWLCFVILVRYKNRKYVKNRV